MPGRAKCEPGCECEKHGRPRMSPEQQKARQREISRAHYEANRERILERQRQDPERRARERQRVANLSPEERERRAQLNREWYRRNPRSPEKNAEMHYRARYGLSMEQRAQMAVDQNGLCYLCSDPLPTDTRKVHTDHDRSCCPQNTTCGQCIRGLACEGCNTGIGQFGDDPGRLRRAADALEAANARVRTRSKSD